jgi:hypothetical protein
MPIQLGATGIRFNDNSVQTTAASGGGLGGTTVFTSVGATGFTIPSGKTVVKVTVQGGGGSGAGGGSLTGSGGGGGGAAIKYLTGLTPGNTLTVTVGAGQTGSEATGAAGGTSSVASGTQSITTISATGGAGGSRANVGYDAAVLASGGAGGSGTNGDINITGGSGFNSVILTNESYLTFQQGGNGGDSLLGFGGSSNSAIFYPQTSGGSGTGYGGGGAGSVGGNTNQSGGSSTAGVVIFEY